MDRRKMLMIVSLILLSLLLIIIPASATSEKISVDSYEVYCTYEQDPGVWWEGNVLHERGSVQTGFRIPLSEEDPIQGADYYTLVNVNINHNTYKGTAFGTFVSTPEGMNGTIEGTWTAKLYRLAPQVWPVSEGRAVGHGTGDLKGLKVVTEFSSMIDYSQFPVEYWLLVFEKCGLPPYDFLGISITHNTYLLP